LAEFLQEAEIHIPLRVVSGHEATSCFPVRDIAIGVGKQEEDPDPEGAGNAFVAVACDLYGEGKDGIEVGDKGSVSGVPEGCYFRRGVGELEPVGFCILNLGPMLDKEEGGTEAGVQAPVKVGALFEDTGEEEVGLRVFGGIGIDVDVGELFVAGGKGEE
jgi:hypothetical protein